MIAGSVSKVSEGILACSDTIVAQNDLIRITGAGIINTIKPGLGTAQGQFLMLVPLDGPITLGTEGNISGGLTIPRYNVVHLVFSKPLQKWLLPVAVAAEEEEDMAETVYVPFNQANFSADEGTWTFLDPANNILTILYYIHGKRVTITFIAIGAIFTPSGGVRTIRMRLPQAVSNLAVYGPYSFLPTERSVYVGQASLSPDTIDFVTTIQPCTCVVADNNKPLGPYLAITPEPSGFFPANPPAGWTIAATCTYILER